MESIYLLPVDRHPWHRRRCHRHGGRCPQPLVTLRRRQRLLTQCRATSASSAAAVGPPLSTTEVPLLLASSSLVRDGPNPISSPPCYSPATIFLSSSTGKVALAASPRYCHNLACLSPATHHHSPSPPSLSEASLLPAAAVASSRALCHCHRCCHAAAPLSPATTLVVPL
ncbi:hypothetical protein BHE74_00025109 [Ensete ventricosum]|nr:hypothetical protein BHE74_00025109 [Ensete ventricosum]